MPEQDDEFDRFVIARSPSLLRAAWLLTGNEASAHDLVQTALLKTWQRWEHVAAPDAYVRKAMMSIFLSWRRRRASSEIPVALIPDVAELVDELDRSDVSAAVRSAVQALPPRQRAAVVLRYFAALPEAQAAAALGCTVGTIKSQTARALARLRTSPALVGVWSEEASRER